MPAWIKDALKVFMLGALFGFVVPFLASKFSEKELIVAALVFLIGIFWRLTDILDHVRGVAAKLGYHRTRSRRINELFKTLGHRELTKAEDEELDELTNVDHGESPATLGSLMRVIDLLQELIKLLKTTEAPPTARP